MHTRLVTLRVHRTKNTGLFYLSSENVEGNVNYFVNTQSIAKEMLWQRSRPVYTSLLVFLSLELNTKIAQALELQYARRYIQNSISCSITRCNITKMNAGESIKEWQGGKDNILYNKWTGLSSLQLRLEISKIERFHSDVSCKYNRTWFHHIFHTLTRHITLMVRRLFTQ
jgi:hypothetical protein